MHLRPCILRSAAALALAIPLAQQAAAATHEHCVSAARAAALVAWKPRAWTPATGTQLSNGLWISIDPVDGTRGMPTADQMRAMGMAARAGDPAADDAPVLIEHLADGTILANLDDRWAEFAMVTLGADGKPAWRCVSGRQAAAKFLAQPPVDARAATVKREEK